MSIKQLGYVRLGVQNVTEWAAFAQDVLGFNVGEISGDVAFLRMDEAPFRYIVEKNERDYFIAAGYELADKVAFDAQVATLEAAHVVVTHGTADGAAQRAVQEYASCNDPSGNLVEFYHSRGVGGAVSLNAGVSGFKTDPMGLGHLVLPAAENIPTEKFYTELFGFGISDDLSLPAFAEGMPEQRILFMHADNPRHHTLGLYNFPNPVGLIHLMAELNSIDEVGACMDRVKQAGLHIFASLGRHANDGMVSFYFVAPGGFVFEIGYDGKQFDDWSKFTPTKSTVGDLWGHEYDVPDMGDMA